MRVLMWFDGCGWVGAVGWVVGLIENEANRSSKGVEVGVEAELGNKNWI